MRLALHAYMYSLLRCTHDYQPRFGFVLRVQLALLGTKNRRQNKVEKSAHCDYANGEGLVAAAECMLSDNETAVILDLPLFADVDVRASTKLSTLRRRLPWKSNLYVTSTCPSTSPVVGCQVRLYFIKQRSTSLLHIKR
jgi:hypothetical protein